MRCILFIILCVLLFNCSEVNAKPPKTYLTGKIPEDDKRYRTMLCALELIGQRQCKIIVETGTFRNAHRGKRAFLWDGGFTFIFGRWARDNDCLLYSVDINPDAIASAQQVVGHIHNVHLVCEDSITFLNQFEEPIDLLYLDSYDFDINNPQPSQEHHLKEIIAAYPNLHAASVIMIDDWGIVGGNGGKGGLVVPFLLEHAWKILAEGYQIVLVADAE